MNQMFWAGTICWVICSVVGLSFAYITRDKMTKSGVLWKGLASLSITIYAFVLAVLSGPISEASGLFIVGLLTATFGDSLMGYLQYRQQGSAEGLSEVIVNQERNIWRVGVGVVAVSFIVSYFIQMVAFIKGLAKLVEPADYVVPFIVFFMLPPLFTVIGGILARFRVPEVSTSIFVVGVFYVVLTGALFASASVYSYALFPMDANHAIFIEAGAVIFFLSMLFVLIRYSNPQKYESRLNRFMSRLLTFFGRMILAGCAFMF